MPYRKKALAKSSVGVGLPKFERANIASFLLVFLFAASAHLNGELGESAPARRFLLSGKTNLIQFATSGWSH
ncbi:hypothetical protein [Veronia pacifica]|uniref:Uncharacterized protein n=1 Tax=Veronia pacifica TaxID=1080227 RepID=A0A1C3E6K4_9GAMM|nr:hypothetical protein [Veronia pacifica]ODA28872.1 hypothetical protein A8L45_22920 [Veronia pacifica]